MDVGGVPRGGLEVPHADQVMDVSGGHFPTYMAQGGDPEGVGVDHLGTNT